MFHLTTSTERKDEKDSNDYENSNQIQSLHAETRCRSVHARGFTAGQKKYGKSGLGHRAVVGRGPPGLRAA